jgi:hypothetical protein
MNPLPNHLRLDEPAVYRIIVQGRLDPKWSAEFPAMQIRTVKTGYGMTLTAFTGLLPDQSSLHGMLNLIRNYGLVLLGLNLEEFEIPDKTEWSEL